MAASARARTKSCHLERMVWSALQDIPFGSTDESCEDPANASIRDSSMPRKKQHKRGYLCYRSRQRGIALLASVVSTIMLFGMAGLAIDIGRMYITKNEAHGYADGAAIAAARRLDGTSLGLTNADGAVTASTNRWNFGTSAFSGTVVEYSTDGSTGWGSSGGVAPAKI